MKACILGVGRSGTTMLYYLLQEIFSVNYGADFKSVYEPFLWDKPVWGKRDRINAERWQTFNSVSIEGMYWNKKYPMLIKNPDNIKNDQFLKDIFHTHENLVLKFIRGCGRLKLLNKICPECKFIFIIRNPFDVLNSVVAMFSFYGDDFHASDFPRFIKETNKIFSTDLKADTITNIIHKEALYWYYMNRFALETLRTASTHVEIICYEDFVENKSNYIRKLINFLNFDNDDNLLTTGDKVIGPSTTQINLSAKDLKLIKPYFLDYLKLLDEFNIVYNKRSLLKIPDKYRLSPAHKSFERKYIGKSPKHLKNQLMVQEESIKSNIKIIEQQKSVIENKEKVIREILIKKDNKENFIKEQKNKITDKENAIRELLIKKDNKEKFIKEQKNKIENNERKIQDLKRQIRNYNDTIEKMYNSYSWKIGTFIIKVIKFFIGWIPLFKRWTRIK